MQTQYIPLLFEHEYFYTHALIYRHLISKYKIVQVKGMDIQKYGS